MSLLLMPAEILQQICRYICKTGFLVDGHKEYRSLAQSCRLLYKIALPYLYRYLHLDPCSTHLLLRSTMEKPELVLMIKDVTMAGCHRRKGRIDLGKAYTLLRKPGLLPKTCTRYLHPDDHNTISVLLVEALLLQLSSLEELSINIYSFPQNMVLFDRKRWKPGNRADLPHFLPALREFSVFGHPLSQKRMRARSDERESQAEGPGSPEDGSESEDEREYENRDILAQTQYLIKLSKPRELYIETDYTLKCPSFSLELPSLEKIDVFCEGMSEEDFEHFLRACPNVHSLAYDGGTGQPLSDDYYDELVSVQTIVTALRHRQHTLESLEIGFHYDEDGYIMRYDTIPDLREFSRLTNLKLDWNALFELPQHASFLPMEDAKIGFIDRVPRTLEKLRIFQAYEKHLDELKSLAHKDAQTLPKFKTLILEWWDGETDEPLNDLGIELSKAGIELVLE